MRLTTTKHEKIESTCTMRLVLPSTEHHALTNCACIRLYYIDKNFRYYCSQVVEYGKDK